MCEIERLLAKVNTITGFRLPLCLRFLEQVRLYKGWAVGRQSAPQQIFNG
jgi:hypothetical protein